MLKPRKLYLFDVLWSVRILFEQASYINEEKIVPNTDNLRYLQFYIFTILYCL